MDENEIKETILRYSKRLNEYGISEKALGWGEKGRSRLRYEILSSAFNLDDATVLDFGCGFGTFYDLLSAKEINVKNFTGIDINPDFIGIAKSLYQVNADFYCINLLDSDLAFSVDYSFSSGVFNHRLKDNDGFIEKVLNKLNEISNKGFAVNFLSDKVQFRHNYTFHSNPGKILEMCYQFSNNIVLRNDYMPYEFSVFVNKNSVVDSKYTVYEEYRRFM